MLIPWDISGARWRKHFPRYWLFARGIPWSPVNSPHKGQWRAALMLSLICAWTNSWVNNRDAGDLRHHHAHYDVTVMVLNRRVRHRWCPGLSQLQAPAPPMTEPPHHDNSLFSMHGFVLFVLIRLMWLHHQTLRDRSTPLIIYFIITNLATPIFLVYTVPSHSARKPRLDPSASVRSSMEILEPVEITWFDRLPQKGGPKAGAFKVGPS